MNRHLALSVVMMTVPFGVGCAMQAATGYASGNPDAAPRVIDLEARLLPSRISGPLLGLQSTVVAQDIKQPVRLRSIAISAGYHQRTAYPFPLGFGGEVTGDIGTGMPPFVDLSDPGFYLGTSGTLTYRIAGPDDSTPEYDTLAILVDIATTGRLGVWTAYEGTPRELPNGVLPVGAVHLGLRVTLVSNLTSSTPEIGR